MDIIGVVSEYNPFHLGHAHHLRQSRALVGDDAAVVCVLSGDFVQRGEAAMYSKFARAEAACRSGADLVIELPLPWCAASAEGFAQGAVSLLGALGATYLSFGSETGETEPLAQLARTLLEPDITGEIKTLMANDATLPFAAARQRVLETRLGKTGALLSQPNNILAVEYLKAIYNRGHVMAPVTIKRLGAGHDTVSESSGPRSASQLREMIAQGADVSGYIPKAANRVYAREREQGRELADKRPLEVAMLSRLRLFDEAYFNALPDAAEGLGSRIYRAVREESSLEGIYMAAKTKRYALARIRRICLCACLGITAGMGADAPPYARVLAANRKGRELLRNLARTSTVPILTKPAAVRELPDKALKIFTMGAAAHDLYVLGYGDSARPPCGEDWRTGPSIL